MSQEQPQRHEHLTSKEAVMKKATENQKDGASVTIGEALEASALTRAGEKEVDMSDAAAIQAAEMRATRKSETEAGGVGATAQSAATRNFKASPYSEKTTLSEVLSNAREKLSSDKKATKEDAEGVIGAEVRNKRDMMTTPGGVAASVLAASELNQNKK